MIEFILNVLVCILALAVLWFSIFITIGTDLSGTTHGVGTTTLIFILVLLVLAGIVGLGIIIQQFFFI
jgi:hypothetical protein